MIHNIQIVCRLIGALALLGAYTAGPAHAAGGWTNSATPTNIQIVRNEGFLIHGPFGNPGPTACGLTDLIWVSATHPQYKELLSTSLTALAAGLKVQAYAHNYVDVGWWSASTVNALGADGALFIQR